LSGCLKSIRWIYVRDVHRDSSNALIDAYLDVQDRREPLTGGLPSLVDGCRRSLSAFV
jgi:hypothetical protein